MTRAGRWKWTVPGLVLLAGCAALDDGPMPSLPDPPTVARFRPSPSLPLAMPPAPVSAEKPAAAEKPPAEKPAAAEPVVQVKADTPAPAPATLPPATDAAPATAVPVSLDAVMRLAEDQNAQVAL